MIFALLQSLFFAWLCALQSRAAPSPVNAGFVPPEPAYLLIRGGTVVNHDQQRRADVLIDAGSGLVLRVEPDIQVGSNKTPPMHLQAKQEWGHLQEGGEGNSIKPQWRSMPWASWSCDHACAHRPMHTHAFAYADPSRQRPPAVTCA